MHLLKRRLSPWGWRLPTAPKRLARMASQLATHRRPGGDGQRRGQHRSQHGLPDKAPGAEDGGVEMRFGLC